jgi:hypothetical protein
VARDEQVLIEAASLWLDEKRWRAARTGSSLEEESIEDGGSIYLFCVGYVLSSRCLWD